MATERDITDSASLNDALLELLSEAHRNGVAVTGGWECLTDGSMPDWDVHVTEMGKRRRRPTARG